MSLLERVITGKNPKPRRVLLYGTHGIGKSTFGAMSESPIFIPTEDGLGDIDCARFPLAKSFDDVRNALIALHENEHDYKTVVIDSMDWLEKLIFAEVCKRRNVGSIEDIDYGKGYIFAIDLWLDITSALDSLRDNLGMTIILIAHAQTERFNNPETESYDRYSPALNKHSSAKLQEWCDEVLFATRTVFTKTEDQGFKKKRTQAISSDERVLRTIERAAYLAKNRLNLPDEIPLDYRVFAAYARGERPDGATDSSEAA